jgi:membrane fusion protein (multidrug efflux system)
MNLQCLVFPSLLAGAGLCATVGLRSSHAATQTPPKNVILAITEPSKRVEMSFPSYGIIEEVFVKEGDAIKDGQVLMKQDDEIDRLELARAKAEADSNARLAAAEADLGVKKKTYERKSKAGGGVYADSEIEEAELDVTFRFQQVEIAKLENSTNKIKAEQQSVKVEDMSLKAEFDGIVERIDVWEGEVSDPQKPSIFVVRNDPMYVVIRHLTTPQVSRLRVGQTLEVRYPDQKEWKPAKIWYIAPVADASSDTQVIKLELANPDNQATGKPIEVKLPDNVVDAERATDTTAANR